MKAQDHASIGMTNPRDPERPRASGRWPSMITASETTTNAKSVPMLVISPRIWIGVNPATMATTTPVISVVM
jgi:hypothetical protein